MFFPPMLCTLWTVVKGEAGDPFMVSSQSIVLVGGSWRCRSRKQRSFQLRRAWATAPVSKSVLFSAWQCTLRGRHGMRRCALSFLCVWTLFGYKA